MKKFFTTFIFFCLVLNASAQNVVFKESFSRPKHLTYYALNHLGDVSTIINNEITKTTTQRTFTFKEPFLGTVAFYDERNPLQQLVFYKNTRQIIILDNQLSIKDRWILSENFPEIDVSYAALTAQSTVWVFDEISKRWCILSSEKEQPVFVSNPVVHYDFLTSSGNYAYWQSGTKVYGIDIYGKLMKEQTLPENTRLLAINGNKIAYQLNNTVFLFDSETNTKEPLKEIETTVEKAFFNAGNISILTSDKLFLYNIN